jgi:hypothetical protein
LVNFAAKFIPENKVICFEMGNKMEDPLAKRKTSLKLKRVSKSFMRNISMNNPPRTP